MHFVPGGERNRLPSNSSPPRGQSDTGKAVPIKQKRFHHLPRGNALLKRNAEFLSGYIRQSTGYAPRVKALKEGETVKNAIGLGLDADIADKEGYTLTTTSEASESTAGQRTAYSTAARHYGNLSPPQRREPISRYRQATSKTNPALHTAACISTYAGTSSLSNS